MNPDSPWLRSALVVAITFIVDEAVLAGFRIDGVRPDLLLGLGIAAALVARPEEGAIVAFAAALIGDFFVNTPFGLSALVACVVAFTAGTIHDSFGLNQRWSVPVLTTVASGVAVVTWAVMGTVLGIPGLLGLHLVVIAVVIAVVNSAVSWPMVKAMQWAFGAAPGANPTRLPRSFAA